MNKSKPNQIEKTGDKPIDPKTHALNYQSFNQRRLAQQQPIKDKINIASPTRKNIEQSLPQDDFKKQYDIQSQKICELQSYKTLCENYIERLNPNQKFPLAQNDLKNITPKKYTVQETAEESIKLQNEKEQLIATLQKETVLNEQQRNYIEILKQTIESNLMKNGLGQLMQSSKGYQTQPTLDSIIDISRAQNENEKSRKELSMAQMLINELKSELDSSKKSYEDLTVLSNILKEKLEREKVNTTDLVNQLASKEQETFSLEETIKGQNDQLKTIKVSLSDYQALCSKYEKEIFENGRKLNEMTNTIGSYQILQKKFNDNKDSYDRLDFEYQRQSKDKNDIEINNHKLKEEIAQLKEDKKKMQEEIVLKEETYQKNKKVLLEEKEQVRRTLTKSETNNADMTNLIQRKEREINERQEKHIEAEKLIISLQTQLKQISDTYENYKSQTETSMQIDTDKIIQSNQRITELSKQMHILEGDNDLLHGEVFKLKDINSKLGMQLEELKLSKEKIDTLSSNLSNEYEGLVGNYRQLEIESNRVKVDNDGLQRELMYWREKYDKDTALKGEEVIELNNNLKKTSYHNEELSKKNDKMQFDIHQKNEEIQKMEGSFHKLLAEMTQMKNENDVLEKTLAEKSRVIRNEEQSTYELTGQLNTNLGHMKDLSNEVNLLKEKIRELESLLKEQNDSNDILKEANAMNDKKLCTITQSLNNHCKSINQCVDLLSSYAVKFSSKQQTQGVMPFYSREFSEYIKDIIANQQKLNSLSPIEKLNEVQVFFAQLNAENFNWINYIIDLSHSLEDYRTKLSSLQVEVEKYEMYLKEKDTSLEINNNKLKEVYDNHDSIKKSNETLISKLSTQQGEISSASYELTCLKDENCHLHSLTHHLTEQNDKKDSMLFNANNQVEALEERIIVLSKEKKYYEDVITKLGQNSDNRETAITVNNILSVCDEISQLERQKINNIGQNSTGYDRQLKTKIEEYNRLCCSIGRNGNKSYLPDYQMTYDYQQTIGQNRLGNNLTTNNNNSLRLDDTFEHLGTCPNNFSNNNSFMNRTMGSPQNIYKNPLLSMRSFSPKEQMHY